MGDMTAQLLDDLEIIGEGGPDRVLIPETTDAAGRITRARWAYWDDVAPVPAAPSAQTPQPPAEPEPGTITGLDGKTYALPRPTALAEYAALMKAAAATPPACQNDPRYIVDDLTPADRAALAMTCETRCLIRDACLAYATEARPEGGIWAGYFYA